jgi:hypothetical protein
MGFAFNHAPFAYLKKSTPGLTVVSTSAARMSGICFGSDRFPQEERSRAQTVSNTREMEERFIAGLVDCGTHTERASAIMKRIRGTIARSFRRIALGNHLGRNVTPLTACDFRISFHAKTPHGEQGDRPCANFIAVFVV